MASPTQTLERRAAAQVGTTLRGKYRIERVLGAGGMATVYAAVHRNGNRVAVKVLHPELSLRSDVSARFLREGYLANRVGHPGAVRVLDDDVAENGTAFVVMELLRGETLRARCKRRDGRLPCREVLALGHQLLDVLGAAHAAGIVHRDIKPDNLFLTTDRVLKVLDFGIARLDDDGALATATGTRLGTPAFMPPELALGRTAEIDARTDIWSAGATLFQLLSGQIVHEAPTSAELVVRAATVPPRSLAAAAPELPAAVVALVDRALAFSREDRWPSARAMQEALEAAHVALFGEPVSPTALDDVVEAAPPGVDPEGETLDASAKSRATRPDRGALTTAGSSTAGAHAATATTLASTALPHGQASAVAPPAAPGAPRATARTTFLAAAGACALMAAAGGVLWGMRRDTPSGAPGVASSPCPPRTVLIPGGAFAMGDAAGKPDELPAHRVTVAPFCLDVDEVSVAAYATCVETRGCSPLPTTVERLDLTDADRLFESANCTGATTSRHLLHPVNCVDHAAATRFCASLGQRLPTEEEWEYAARGGDEQRRYPWGDQDPDPTRLNACDHACWEIFDRAGRPWGHMFDSNDGFPRTAPVGSFRAGDSRWGVHDMEGNVSEWTSSPYCPYPKTGCESPYRVYRGGDWDSVLRTTVQTPRRWRAPPTARDATVGFRCAKSLGTAP